MSSLRYPACDAHASYWQLRPARVYNIFPHYLINGTIFWLKNLRDLKCVYSFSLQLLPEKFLIIRISERDMIINVYCSSCKVSAVHAMCSRTLSFIDRFSKSTQISIFMKIRPGGAQLFHVDGHTHTHDEADSRFPQFLRKASQNACTICRWVLCRRWVLYACGHLNKHSGTFKAKAER